MKMKWIVSSLLMISCATAGLVYIFNDKPAESHIPTNASEVSNLTSKLANSDAVVYGVVSNVEYQMSSEKGEFAESLPYAFVTYKIRQVIAGEKTEEEVTLRFIGGPDGQGDFLEVTGVPAFQVGQQDILFIQNNGEDDCPLVHCGNGRFQIYENRVYDSHGVPVVGIVKGVVEAKGLPQPALLQVSYPAPSFDDLLKREDIKEILSKVAPQGNIDILRERYQKEAPKTIDFTTELAQATKDQDSGSESTPSSQPRLSTEGAIPLDKFIEVLQKQASSIKGTGRKVISVNPKEPFNANVLVPTKPSEALVRETPKLEETDQDKRERLLLEKQDFNPVLKESPVTQPTINPTIKPGIIKNPGLKIPSPTIRQIDQ
ncbi:hypothetical protein IQ247_17730 [Plectonema cf. radiosum LEGE 06105]|uniref:Uncharacterized protein n=1 Tax=Plectonema cf. radiosum LEGE 06105 TaxID=945769 RepID=A0A8J7K153_9CYAN|nr:hypothetical protein [Plectonema radiosum]MBE9214486.1 hypothetical protein [Plectonema cf. radiosum LEGE 06105]